MTGTVIITDSAACIPPPLVEEYGIHIVPLMLVLDGKVYPDRADGDGRRFYEHLKTTRQPPTTSSPPPGQYLEAFRRLSNGVGAALCIAVNSRFSVSYDSALQAAEMARRDLPELRVKVIDSGAAAMAQGFMVLEAARAVAAGADLETAAARVEALKPRVAVVALLDTLDYLARGGRVPRAAAWASSLLQVKPITELSNSGVRLLARTRLRRRALERLFAIMQERGEGRRLHLCVHHADALDDALELAERARRTLKPVELYVSEFTRVMSVHTGPGLLGFAYYVQA